jgi:L-amino acid N-acyltransferase YncA
MDESIPELGVGVYHRYRGCGIGKALLIGLLEHARQQGIGAVSLSVERDNPALRLYSALGFVVAGEVGKLIRCSRRSPAGELRFVPWSHCRLPRRDRLPASPCQASIL